MVEINGCKNYYSAIVVIAITTFAFVAIGNTRSTEHLDSWQSLKDEHLNSKLIASPQSHVLSNKTRLISLVDVQPLKRYFLPNAFESWQRFLEKPIKVYVADIEGNSMSASPCGKAISQQLARSRDYLTKFASEILLPGSCEVS